jgi:hypothetical protein
LPLCISKAPEDETKALDVFANVNQNKYQMQATLHNSSCNWRS